MKTWLLVPPLQWTVFKTENCSVVDVESNVDEKTGGMVLVGPGW